MTKTAIFCLLILFTGCMKIETRNAAKAYEYWAGEKPPKNIRLINGEYYRSPHFTLEYELFLKFKSDKKWFSDFVQYNGLVIDTKKGDWARWNKLPDWFTPDSNSLIYAKDPTNEFETSRYFINRKTGTCYIYETVGM